MFQNSNVSTVASLPYCTQCKELHRPCTVMRLVSVHLVLNNKHSVSTVGVACPNSRTHILKDDYWQQRVMLTYSFDLTEWLFHYSTNTIWFLTVVGLYVSRTCDFECRLRWNHSDLWVVKASCRVLWVMSSRSSEQNEFQSWLHIYRDLTHPAFLNI